MKTFLFILAIIALFVVFYSIFSAIMTGRASDRCSIDAEFKCVDFLVQQTAPSTLVLTVAVINKLGNTVDFDNIDTAYNASSQFGYSDGVAGSGIGCTFTPQIALVGGGRAIITCIMDSAGASYPVVGKKIKIAFDFKYKEFDKAFWVPLHAEVLATIVE